MRNILTIFSALLILNLFLAAGWWFFFQHIQDIRGDIIGLKGGIVTAELKQKNIRSLDLFLKDIEAERQKVENFFVDERSVVRFIEDLEETAELSQVNLVVESASLPRLAAEGGPTFQFTAKGGFDSLFTFLSLLESINYQIELEEVTFIKMEGQGVWEGRFKTQLLSYLFNE